MAERDVAVLLREGMRAAQSRAMLAPTPSWADPEQVIGYSKEPAKRVEPARCASTGNLRFDTRQDALAYLRRVQARPMKTADVMTGRPAPSNVRYCHSCKGHHMTTKAGKAWKHGKRREW